MTGCERTLVVRLLRRPTHDDDNLVFDLDVSEVLVRRLFRVDRVPAEDDLARELRAAAKRADVEVFFELQLDRLVIRTDEL